MFIITLGVHTYIYERYVFIYSCLIFDKILGIWNMKISYLSSFVTFKYLKLFSYLLLLVFILF